METEIETATAAGVHKKMTKLFSLLAVFLFVTCAPSEEIRSDQKYGQGWEGVAQFEVPKLKSASYDLFLHLRNDNTYPFANIFLIARLKADSLVLHTDTLEYTLADPSGKWLGTGFSDVKESMLYWKENIPLSDSIAYQIEIEQAQRAQGSVSGYESLPGIVSVGYSLLPKN